MDWLWLAAASAALVGALGFAAGWLIGAGIARWARATGPAVRITGVAAVVVLAGFGIQQASSVRTVPESTADARAHDSSLAAMWQGLILWTCGVNAVGAVVGVRRGARRPGLPAAEDVHADERT